MEQTDAISRSAVLTVGNIRKVTEYDEAHDQPEVKENTYADT